MMDAQVGVTDAQVGDAAGGADRDEDFTGLARALQAQDSAVHTLEAMCRLAVHALDGAEHVGITVVRGQGFQTPAATDDVPRAVDRIQYQTNEGPCVDAIRDHETFLSQDLAAEARWPQFSRRVTSETGVRSMLSFRLFLQGDTLGALNFCSTRVGAFTARDQALGAAFATHAAVAMRSAQQHDQISHLQAALASNRRIGAAMGILMARHHLTEDDAFARLRASSQESHRKLRDVADAVLLAGELPDPPPAVAPGRTGHGNPGAAV